MGGWIVTKGGGRRRAARGFNTTTGVHRGGGVGGGFQEGFAPFLSYSLFPLCLLPLSLPPSLQLIRGSSGSIGIAGLSPATWSPRFRTLFHQPTLYILSSQIPGLSRCPLHCDAGRGGVPAHPVPFRLGTHVVGSGLWAFRLLHWAEWGVWVEGGALCSFLLVQSYIPHTTREETLQSFPALHTLLIPTFGEGF